MDFLGQAHAHLEETIQPIGHRLSIPFLFKRLLQQ